MASVNTSVWNIIGSMRAVDKWSQAAQSNIGNSTKVGYKQYDVTFNGGFATTVMKHPTLQRAGTQIAEQLIGLAYTSIDWRQGELIKSEHDTDFAINGMGFFMLTEGVPAPGKRVFYTRDGQFHTDDTGRLRSNNGLYYVTGADANAMGLPSVAVTGQHALAMPGSLNSLRYSQYGSTIFETLAAASTFTVGDPETQGLGQVNQFTLEASNVDTEKQLLSLKDSKNAYAVLAKQLTVFWQNFDIGLNLLK